MTDVSSSSNKMMAPKSGAGVRAKRPKARSLAKPSRATSKVQSEAAAPPAAAGGKHQEPKALKAKKMKVALVRDSFTMPKDDLDLISTLKKRAMTLGVSAKKSEVLRAGIHALAGLTASQLTAALARLTPIKVGRPKKS